MTDIANANSLFELAFGVNAVFTAISTKLYVTKERVASSYATQIKIYIPDFSLREDERSEFEDFVFRSSTGLRFANYLNYIPSMLSVCVVLLSLGALILSAIEPKRPIANTHVIVFSVTALIICPAIYFLHQRFLEWLSHSLITRAAPDASEAKEYVGYFRLAQNLKSDHQHATAVIQEMALKQLSTDVELFKGRVKRFRRRVGRIFSFQGKRVDKRRTP